MPTIEIVSFERKNLIKIDRRKYNFAIRQNSKLKSHRSLFWDYLSKSEGVILHVGNLDLAKERFFFAGELIDWEFEETDIVYLPVIDPEKSYEEQWSGSDQSERFKFIKDYIEGIDKLIRKAVKLSPTRSAALLTDHQFGPSTHQYVHLNKIEEFWNIHKVKGLKWNTMYIIHEQI